MRSSGGGPAEAGPGDTEQKGAGRQAFGWVKILRRQSPHDTVSKGFRTLSGTLTESATSAPQAQDPVPPLAWLVCSAAPLTSRQGGHSAHLGVHSK